MLRDSLSHQHIHRSKKFKSGSFKGLGRLRYYCTACCKQCRDENGFKQHTQSESHMHKIDAIGSNLGRTLDQLSQRCLSDFLSLLKLNHGGKSVQVNRFYQTYISDSHHVHLKDTRWCNLTRLAEWLGREGHCRVEEKDDGVYIAWIDRSPEAARQAAALSERKREEAADQRREHRQLEEQVKRAHAHSKRQTSPSPMQHASLGWARYGDAAIAFQLGPKATASTSHTPQPNKTQNILKLAGRKGKRPVEEPAEFDVRS